MVNLINNYKVQEGLEQTTISQIGVMVLTSPKDAISKIIGEKKKALSISILLIASVSIALSFFLLLSNFCPINSTTLVFGYLLYLAKTILGFFIAGAFIHFTAGFFSANGHPKSLFLGLFLTLLPFSFLLPLTIFSLGTTPLLGLLTFPLLAVWSFYLLLLVLQEVYQVSLTKALFILIIPYLTFYIAGFLILSLGIGAILVNSFC